MLNFYFLSMTN